MHRAATIGLARAAVAKHPERPELRLLLAQALAASGEAAEALEALESACRLFPADESLREELARTLARTGDLDSALAALGDGRRHSPLLARIALQLLRRHGRGDEAVQLEPVVAAAFPADFDLLESRACRLHDDPAELLRVANSVLAHDRAAAHGLYYKAIALAQLGRGGEAVDLMALDRFVVRSRLPAVDGFADDALFRAAIADEIRSNPSLHPDTVGYATRHGLRTGIFPAPGDRAAVALVRLLRREVERYAEALSGDHPFVAARPDRARFTPWALLLRGEGHQELHYHPGRWVTGVVYLAAPGDGAGGGALRIGLLPDWAGVDPPWPVIDVEPRPGTLLLFPSYVPHATLPTGQEAERISVAFDVADSGDTKG